MVESGREVVEKEGMEIRKGMGEDDRDRPDIGRCGIGSGVVSVVPKVVAGMEEATKDDTFGTVDCQRDESIHGENEQGKVVVDVDRTGSGAERDGPAGPKNMRIGPSAGSAGQAGAELCIR